VRLSDGGLLLHEWLLRLLLELVLLDHALIPEGVLHLDLPAAGVVTVGKAENMTMLKTIHFISAFISTHRFSAKKYISPPHSFYYLHERKSVTLSKVKVKFTPKLVTLNSSQ
jgi:hypothetical protein